MSRESFQARKEQHMTKHINQAPTAIANYHGFVLPYATQPQQLRILDKMKQSHLPDFTIGELSYLTNMDKSTVSARRNAMLQAGTLILGTERKCKFSEKVCQTVKLPEAI